VIACPLAAGLAKARLPGEGAGDVSAAEEEVSAASSDVNEVFDDLELLPAQRRASPGLSTFSLLILLYVSSFCYICVIIVV
jgi:hypothetical protein